MLSVMAAWLLCGLSFTACTPDIADNPVVVPDPQPQFTVEGFFTPEINRLIDENYPDLVALQFLKARATLDSSLQKYADYWK